MRSSNAPTNLPTHRAVLSRSHPASERRVHLRSPATTTIISRRSRCPVSCCCAACTVSPPSIRRQRAFAVAGPQCNDKHHQPISNRHSFHLRIVIGARSPSDCQPPPSAPSCRIRPVDPASFASPRLSLNTTFNVESRSLASRILAANMLRPATPLSILFFVAFVLLLLSTLSAPIIRSIPIASYRGISFGVLGYCENNKPCEGPMIGYNTGMPFPQIATTPCPQTHTSFSTSSIQIKSLTNACTQIVCFKMHPTPTSRSHRVSDLPYPPFLSSTPSLLS